MRRRGGEGQFPVEIYILVPLARGFSSFRTGFSSLISTRVQREAGRLHTLARS